MTGAEEFRSIIFSSKISLGYKRNILGPATKKHRKKKIKTKERLGNNSKHLVSFFGNCMIALAHESKYLFLHIRNMTC